MRLTQIDGLRGLAAVSVLLFHLTTKYAEFFHRDTLFQAPHGHYGVHLFFAISGFVILMTLTKIKTPMDFVVSRFSRLYPTYWAAILITATVMALMPISFQTLSAWQVAANALMLHGFFGINHVDGVYWTLEAELTFYILMLLAWVVGPLKKPLAATSLWLFAALASRLVPVPWTIVHTLLLQWIPWFALGIVAYVLHSRGPDRKLFPLPLALSLACIYLSSGIWTTAFAVAVFAVVFAAAEGWLRILARPILIFFGAISYPLYLLHQNISYSIMTRMDDAGLSPAVVFSVAACLSIGLAYAVHKAIETPAMERIRAWYKRPQHASHLRWAAGISTVVAILAGSSLIR